MSYFTVEANYDKRFIKYVDIGQLQEPNTPPPPSPHRRDIILLCARYDDILSNTH